MDSVRGIYRFVCLYSVIIETKETKNLRSEKCGATEKDIERGYGR